MSAPQQFRRSAAITAIRVPGPNDISEWGFLFGWLARADVECEVIGDDNGPAEGVDIHRPEGTLRANIGDWIVRNERGEFLPCKAEDFNALYGMAVAK